MSERPSDRVFPVALVRTPALSFRYYLELRHEPREARRRRLFDLFSSGLPQQALRAMSPGVAQACATASSAEELSEALSRTLWRYFMRLTTRGTPLGLFAGASSVAVGAYDHVRLTSPDRWRVGVHPSWRVLQSFSQELRRDPRWKATASLRLNPTIRVRGRLLRYYRAGEKTGEKDRCEALIVDESLAALLVLGAPASWLELRGRVKSVRAEAPDEEVDEYLDGLVEQALLIEDDAPSVIGELPHEQLRTLLERADLLETEAGAQVTRYCRRTPRGGLPLSELPAWREDLADHPWVRPLPITHLARESAETQVVLRPSVASGGLPHAQVETIAELVRRWPQQWQTLSADSIRLVDNLLGENDSGTMLSIQKVAEQLRSRASPTEDARASAELDDVPLARRGVAAQQPGGAVSPLKEYFVERMIEAQLEGKQQLELDLDKVEDLHARHDSRQPLKPPFFGEVFGQLVGSKGDPHLTIESVNGILGACVNRLLFWDPDEPMLRQLKALWREEERLHAPSILAEVTWHGARLSDLTMRPEGTTYQLVLGGAASVDREHRIPFEELLLYRADDGPALFWPRQGVRVIPVMRTAVTWWNYSPPELATLMATSPRATSWVLPAELGPSKTLLATPRWTYRGVILKRRSWALSPALQTMLWATEKKTRKLFARELERWRRQYEVPDLVRYGVEGRVVDLDAEDLEDHLKEAGNAALEEILLDPSSAPVEGHDGLLVCEYGAYIRVDSAPQQLEVDAARLAQSAKVEARRHRYSPGSEWMYLQARLDPVMADEVLCGTIKPLVEGLERQRQIDEFHFVRYGDPGFHLRLRLKATGQAWATLPSIGAALDRAVDADLLQSWRLDTYHREVDRYGGEDGVAAAESLFTADTRLVLYVLDGMRSDELEDIRVPWSVRTIHTLLDCFGFDLSARDAFLRRLRERFASAYWLQPSTKAVLSERFAKVKQSLFEIVCLSAQETPSWLPPVEDDPEIARCFADYGDVARRAKAVFADTNRSTASVESVLESVIHMHCNRLWGSREREFVLHDLNHRATASVCARLRKEMLVEPKTRQ